MSDYRYELEDYKGPKTRYTCPSCGKKGEYSRYIDTEMGNYLPLEYGKCNRANNCGYHLNPYKDGYGRREQDTKGQSKSNRKTKAETAQAFTTIPKNIMEASLKTYERNVFAKFLEEKLGGSLARELIQNFQIGTSKYWKGATVFWLIDEADKVAGGQVILFDDMGHTVRGTHADGRKKRSNGWVHTAIKDVYLKKQEPIPNWLKNYSENSPKAPCLFGLPQLEYEPKTKPIAIVEAAKTAVIATAYLPQYIWLAVLGLEWLNEKRLKVLKGRKITLFPDQGGFDKWSQKAKVLSHIGQIEVSDLLERKGDKEGADLADYLLQYDVETFRKSPQSPPPDSPAPKPEPLTANRLSLKEKIQLEQENTLNQMIQRNPILGDMVHQFSLIPAQ